MLRLITCRIGLLVTHADLVSVYACSSWSHPYRIAVTRNPAARLLINLRHVHNYYGVAQKLQNYGVLNVFLKFISKNEISLIIYELSPQRCHNSVVIAFL